jgi:hypothetical protein
MDICMVGFVVKVTGWSAAIPVSTVSVKVMPEFHGPYYYPHGSFVEHLSPVRASKGGCGADTALAWR